MDRLLHWLHPIFQHSPEAALFLSLAIGYAIGRPSIGNWRLGGVAGSMLAALVIGQAGVHIGSDVATVMFIIFVYALGYESGPQFVNAFHRSGMRELAMAVFMAVAGLATVVVLARLFHLDKGLAAGLAAGGLTQAAILGTAGDAIAHLGLGASHTRELAGNLAIGYAVSYVLGSLGAILVCVYVVPRFMGSSLQADARRADAALGAQLAAGEGSALPALVGRLYRVTIASGHTVGDFEIAHQDLVTIEQVQRDGQALPLAPDLALQRDDIVLVIGRRQAMVPAGAALGEEVAEHAGMGVVMQSRRMVFTHPRLNNKTVASIIGSVTREVRHGVYLERIERNGEIIPALPALKLQHGDILTLYGTPADTRRAVGIGGYELVPSEKTDFIYFGSGVLLGLLIGLATSRAALAPFSLGASGGALLSGLLFGWARSRHPMYGAMPSAASRLLRDFGLASFAAVIGLNASLHAAATLREQWPAILALGTLTALVPMLLAMLFGRYVLRYDNAALLAGALAGARTANPAFRTVLEHAGSHAPAVPYASAYALATVLLTLVGTLIVGLA